MAVGKVALAVASMAFIGKMDVVRFTALTAELLGLEPMPPIRPDPREEVVRQGELLAARICNAL
jgi:hypothetical protein